MTATTIRRLGAGYYTSSDGSLTIVHNPAGWVAYVTDDPFAADVYPTLRDAKAAIDRGAWNMETEENDK